MTRLVLVGAAVAAAAAYAGLGSRDAVNPGGWPQVERFLAGAVSPRVDAEFLALTVDAALTTLAFAALGTALALVLGFAGGLVVSRLWWERAAAWTAGRALLAVPRGVHEVVWGLVLLAILGLDPIVAVLAIGLPYGAVTAKVFSELVDEAPRGPYVALRAAGSGRGAAVAYGVLPVAARDLLSYAFYRFECAIRAAAILGLVGAGGLGFQLALSFDALRYEEMWTLLYALIALSGAADLWSSVVRRHGPRAVRRDRVLALSAVAGAALVAWSWAWIGLDPAVLAAAPVLDRAADLAASAVPPRLPDGGWTELARLTLETLAMSVLAAAVAFAGAVALAFPAARGRAGPRGRVTGLASRATLLVLRAIPAPVWALVLLFVLFPGVLPGALALGIYNLGVLGRLMAEAVENIDERPARTLAASGATGAQAFLYATLPAALGRFVAYGVYRWEVAIRETIVVGAVGAGGLGTLLREALARFDHGAALTAILAIVAMTFAVDLVSAALRRAAPPARVDPRARTPPRAPTVTAPA